MRAVTRESMDALERAVNSPMLTPKERVELFERLALQSVEMGARGDAHDPMVVWHAAMMQARRRGRRLALVLTLLSLALLLGALAATGQEPEGCRMPYLLECGDALYQDQTRDSSAAERGAHTAQAASSILAPATSTETAVPAQAAEAAFVSVPGGGDEPAAAIAPLDLRIEIPERPPVRYGAPLRPGEYAGPLRVAWREELWWRRGTGAYVLTGLADLGSTWYAMERGLPERGLAGAFGARDTATVLLVGAGLKTGAYLLYGAMRDAGHERLAHVFLWLSSALQAGASTSNLIRAHDAR